MSTVKIICTLVLITLHGLGSLWLGMCALWFGASALVIVPPDRFWESVLLAGTPIATIVAVGTFVALEFL